MIVIVAPEPTFWLDPILEMTSSISDQVFLVAPWAMNKKAPSWLPSSIQRFWNRRCVSDHASSIRQSLGSFFLEAALKSWAGQKTHRQMETRFLIRKRTDELASQCLPPSAQIVIAPSCAAEKTFAVASRRKIKTVLLEDLPAIRQLHEDLDRALEVHPSCAFLKRYRAPHSWIVRQERERVLANLFMVRGSHALTLHEGLGIPSESIFRLPMLTPFLSQEDPLRERNSPRLLLAGLATARNGAMEALEILKDRPSLTLLVRAGEGMEPTDLLKRSQVKEASRDDLALKQIDLVLAPAWCESYPPEIPLAAMKGIPIVATRRACGFVDLSEVGEEIIPGDEDTLGKATDRLLSKPMARKNLPEESSSVFINALQNLL